MIMPVIGGNHGSRLKRCPMGVHRTLLPASSKRVAGRGDPGKLLDQCTMTSYGFYARGTVVSDSWSIFLLSEVPSSFSTMPRRHYSSEEIIKLLRLVEIEFSKGKTTGQVCKKLGFAEKSYYRWRKEYGGLQINQAGKLKDLEKENTRLKKLVADLSFDKDILNEAIKGNY